MTELTDGQQASADPRAALHAVRTEVAKAVVGQDAAVTGLVIALLCRGHVLLEGVPGRGQDAARARARGRARPRHQAGAVHPRPDAGRRHRLARLRRADRASSPSAQGPVFTNLLLADEINRTPPKTQAALLEAMEERQVSSTAPRGRCPTRSSSRATQNPVEYEGTYPLPEAQLDRFLLKLTVPLPEPRRRDRGAAPARRRLRPARPRRRRRAAGRRRAADLAAGAGRRRLVPDRPGGARPTSSTSCRATRQLAVAVARRLAARRDRAAAPRRGPGPGCPAATT